MVRQFSLMDDAATALRSTGQYRADLTADEVRQVLLEAIQDAVSKTSAVRAEVVSIQVEIAGCQGTVSGGLRLSGLLAATLNAHVALENDPDPMKIRLRDLRIKTIDATFVAKNMVRALNVEGKVRTALADPNGALASVLRPELRAQGVALSDVGLHFTESTLAIELRGSAENT